MSGKKIAYIIVFIIAIAGVAGIILFFNNATVSRDNKIANVNLGNKTTTANTISNTPTPTSKKEKLETTVTELDDGTLYQIGEPLEKIDIVVGDNMYNTQITDFNYNFSEYEGKTIEIEGMYFFNNPYTFVGRFSNVASSCCPQGYAYFEYEWNGDKTPRLVDSITWLKIRGTLTEGNDQYGPYYYIDVNSFEVMNERGMDTVNN